ncbi:MAG: MAPEG family protein [Deltaproteobacteria bacterium]|nr:MAPEG family protein [Deltaproteobacteria bacterium]
MTIPVWVLLGFAGWTVVHLLTTIGVYRWSRILTGRTEIRQFRADYVEGEDWYRRAVRAHANCIENLPVYGAVVVGVVVTGATGPLLDALAIVLMIARVCQTMVHVAFKETNAMVWIRFGFFSVQLACMFWMGAMVVLKAL